LRVKYNPASDAKFRTRNNAEITGLLLVIIITAVTAATNPKIKNKTTSKDILLMENG